MGKMIKLLYKLENKEMSNSRGTCPHETELPCLQPAFGCL